MTRQTSRETENTADIPESERRILNTVAVYLEQIRAAATTSNNPEEIIETAIDSLETILKDVRKNK